MQRYEKKSKLLNTAQNLVNKGDRGIGTQTSLSADEPIMYTWSIQQILVQVEKFLSEMRMLALGIGCPGQVDVG